MDKVTLSNLRKKGLSNYLPQFYMGSFLPTIPMTGTVNSNLGVPSSLSKISNPTPKLKSLNTPSGGATATGLIGAGAGVLAGAASTDWESVESTEQFTSNAINTGLSVIPVIGTVLSMASQIGATLADPIREANPTNELAQIGATSLDPVGSISKGITEISEGDTWSGIGRVLTAGTPLGMAYGVVDARREQRRIAEEKNRINSAYKNYGIQSDLEGNRSGYAIENQVAYGGTLKKTVDDKTSVNSKLAVREYKTGGTHEQNPYGGNPVDAQGNINTKNPVATVEEGEVSFMLPGGKTYMFSNRLGKETPIKEYANNMLAKFNYAEGGTIGEYEIQKGDTLSQLGVRFKVPTATLAEANNLDNPNLIIAGNKLKVPTQFKKELTIDQLPIENKRNIIDNYSKHYDYILEGNKMFYKVKGGRTWADMSDNATARQNLLGHIQKNNYWRAYIHGEKELYDKGDFALAQSTQPVPATYISKPISSPVLGASPNSPIPAQSSSPFGNLDWTRNQPTVDNTNTVSIGDPLAFLNKTTGVPAYKSKPSLRSQMQPFSTLGGTTGAEQYAKSIVEDVKNTVEEAKNWIGRHWGLDEQPNIEEEATGKPLVAVPDSKVLQDSSQNIQSYDYLGSSKVPYKSGYYTNMTIDLSDKSPAKFELLNETSAQFKGDNKKREYDDVYGVTTNLFKPFQEVSGFKTELKGHSPATIDDTPVIAYSRSGKTLKVGHYKDFKDSNDYLVSETFEIPLNFNIQNGKIEVQAHNQAMAKVPVTYTDSTYTGKTTFPIGTTRDDSELEDIGGKKFIDIEKTKKFGTLLGGKAILSNGKTTIQVNGSFYHILKTYNKMLKDNPKAQISAYLLDNGSYNLPLLYETGNLTNKELGEHYNRHYGGGTALALDKDGFLQDEQPTEQLLAKVKENKVFTDKNLTSPNFGNPSTGDTNEKMTPNKIVLHHTGGDLKSTIAQFQDPKSKVSAHTVIDKDGTRYNFNKDNDIMWHAGWSEYKGVYGLNMDALGIELVGDSEKGMTDKQLNSATEYIVEKMLKYQISPNDIVTHVQIRQPMVGKKVYREDGSYEVVQGKRDVNKVVYDKILNRVKEFYNKNKLSFAEAPTASQIEKKQSVYVDNPFRSFVNPPSLQQVDKERAKTSKQLRKPNFAP